MNIDGIEGGFPYVTPAGLICRVYTRTKSLKGRNKDEYILYYHYVLHSSRSRVDLEVVWGAL